MKLPVIPTTGLETMSEEFRTMSLLFEKANEVRLEKEKDWINIQDMYKSQFRTGAITNYKNVFTTGKLLFILMWRVVQRIQLPQFSVQLYGGKTPYSRDQIKKFEMVINAFLSQGVEETGLEEAFLSKFGVRNRLVLYGDSFIECGIDTERQFPTVFRNIPLNDVWVDHFAFEFYSPSGVQDAQFACMKRVYSWDKFIMEFPDAKCTHGDIPVVVRSEQNYDNKTSTQDIEQQDRKIEVLIFQHRNMGGVPVEWIFAGSGGTLISKKEGEEYPHRNTNGEPILSLFHFLCFPSIEGFYNDSIPSLLGDYHQLTQAMMNKAVNAIIKNIDPIYVLSADSSLEKNIQAQIEQAIYDKSQGGPGIMLIPTRQGENTGVRLQSLIGEQMTGEFERLMQQIESIIRQIGINIYDTQHVSGQTLGEAEMIDEKATEFMHQIIEQNESEIERAYTIILDHAKKHIKKGDKTEVRMEIPFEQTEEKPITFGSVKDILSNFKYKVNIKKKTGATSNLSTLMARKKTSIEQIVAINPQSPILPKLMADYLNLQGMDITANDILPPQDEPTEDQGLPQ